MDASLRPGAFSRRMGALVPYLLLLFLALCLLYPAVLRPTWWLWKPNAPHSDLAVTHWPNAHFTRHVLWEKGRFPLWRPTIMSGTPFAANPLAGLYYPPNWLFLFTAALPLGLGFNLSAVLHLWLAGAAMVALMQRGLHSAPWAALVAAVAYQASPKLLAHLGAGHVGWAQAWAWLPLVILCACKASSPRTRLRPRWAIAAGAALAAQFAADVRMSAYTVAAVATLALASLGHQALARVRNGEPATIEGQGCRVSVLKLAITSLAVFLGLSACQWIPAVALLPHTTRSAMTMQDAAVWSLPWRYLAGLLLADHGGYHEWMTYLGASTLVFAGLGARSLRPRPVRTAEHGAPSRPGWLRPWLIGLAALAGWFSLGGNGGLFPVLWGFLPGLGLLRVPPRAWVLVVFSAAVLAGLGTEEITSPGRRPVRRPGRWEWALGLAAATFPPLLAAGYWVTAGRPPVNLVAFGVVTPIAIALTRAPYGRQPPPWLALGAVLLVALDLLFVDVTLITARAPGQVFEDGHAPARWLAQQPGRFRVYSPSYSIPQHVAERYGLELADGVDPLQLRPYADYLTRAAGLPPQSGYSVTLPPLPEGRDVRTALDDVCPHAGLLGQLGVLYAAAAFPMDCEAEGGTPDWEFVDYADGTYLYRNVEAESIPSSRSDMSIALADGSKLFQYDPRPVYVGWVVSGTTVAGLVGWILVQSRDRGTGG